MKQEAKSYEPEIQNVGNDHFCARQDFLTLFLGQNVDLICPLRPLFLDPGCDSQRWRLFNMLSAHPGAKILATPLPQTPHRTNRVNEPEDVHY